MVTSTLDNDALQSVALDCDRLKRIVNGYDCPPQCLHAVTRLQQPPIPCLTEFRNRKRSLDFFFPSLSRGGRFECGTADQLGDLWWDYCWHQRRRRASAQTTCIASLLSPAQLPAQALSRPNVVASSVSSGGMWMLQYPLYPKGRPRIWWTYFLAAVSAEFVWRSPGSRACC